MIGMNWIGTAAVYGLEHAEEIARVLDRWSSPDFNEPNISRNLTLLERLRKVARRLGRTPGEVAIAWTLSNPAVTEAIVGVRSAEQAEGVLRAAKVQLSAEDIVELEGVSE